VSHVLREYQRKACDAPYAYWERKPKGNPLIVLPTGGGKSLVLGTLCQEFIEAEPTTRIVMATHVKELIEQNYAELMGFWPWAPAGIYSASIGRRDAGSQIIFGGIASMFRRTDRIGRVDVLIIDEAHTVPPDAQTMYGKFIAALREINPDMLILGLTATPYRLDSGMLTEGDDALFDDIIYEITIKELIDLGFLCPLVSKATETQLDVKGVGRAGGDFTPTQLQRAVDKHPITEAAVQEIISFATSNEKPRKSWLIFCAGVEHSIHVRDEIRRMGYTAEAITNETDKVERRRIIADYKAGKITALTNANVLTTGFNAPRIDLLAMLRPTESTALYVQMVGRGTRCMGKDIEESIRNGKSDCLVLDFAGNVRRHGPVDRVKVRKPGKGEGDAPVKECPQCKSLIFAGLMECPDCGFKFERDVEKKIAKTADAVPILSSSKPSWVPVKRRTFYRHDKAGGTPSVRVEYLCGFVVHKEWICPEHQGFARVKFEKWWKQHGGGEDAPFSIADTMAKLTTLKQTAEIMIKANGKHWEIIGRKLGEVDETVNPLGYVEPSREFVLAKHDAMVAARRAEEAKKLKPWEKPTEMVVSPLPQMPGIRRATVTQLANEKPWRAKAAPSWSQFKPSDLDDDIPF
jgi:DNA repair protein RadD